MITKISRESRRSVSMMRKLKKMLVKNLNSRSKETKPIKKSIILIKNSIKLRKN